MNWIYKCLGVWAYGSVGVTHTNARRAAVSPAFPHPPILPHLVAVLLLLCCAAPLFALTDDEEAAKKNVLPPAEWIFPSAPPLKVLEVHGRYYLNYNMDRALARLGGASVAVSWHHPQFLRYYPDTYEELMSHQLIIVGNVNGEAFGPVKRAMLKQYVQAGGAVLFLGGRLAFGHSFHGTALEEIAPVTFADKDDVAGAPPGGLTLAPGPDALGNGFAKLAWTEQPRLFWYHDGLTLKPGASVLLTAGGKPLLITGTCGKGRVAVYAGTVLGDPQTGQLPFWEWKDWPTIMAATIDWLTAPQRASDSSLSAEGRSALTTRLLGNRVKHASEIIPRLTRAARVCHDRATAHLLLDAILNLEGEVPLDVADMADVAVRPFVDASFAPVIDTLRNAPRSSEISLALRLQGQMRAPGTCEKLEDALANPTAGAGGGPQDTLEGGGGGKDAVVEDDKDVSFAVRLGALEGLGNLGDPAALSALQTAIKKQLRLRSDPAKFPHEVTQDDELYQEAVLSALRCGDAAQAGPLVDLLLENRYVFVRMMSILDSPDYPGPEHLADHLLRVRVTKALPRVWERQEQLYRKLNDLPDQVLPALAARLAVEDDTRAVPIAFAIFGSGFRKANTHLPPTAVEALKKAVLPAVGDLGQP